MNLSFLSSLVNSPTPSCTYFFIGLLSYASLVRIVRYRRRDGLARKYGYTTRESLSAMTVEDATSIQRDLAMLEFPAVFSFSVFFALFKTFGIPTISALLLTTSQLSSPKTASKRAADTGIMLTEVVLNPPSSPRVIDGVARMNYLHNRYRRAGKISDADMLYTLSLFALEPTRWTARFEWRGLTALERCAMGVFFRDLGEAMEISYGVLEGFMSGGGDGRRTGGYGRDGLEWLESLERWSLAYERDYMVASESNRDLSRVTLDIALYKVPRWLHGAAMGLVGAAFEPRLREAMMIPPPTKTTSVIFQTLITLRKYTLRYLCLPRPEWLRVRYFSDEADPATGKFHALHYVSHPWYVKPTLSSRWGVQAWVTRLSGGTLPGDQGDRYRPEGYHIAELGPEKLEGKGEEEMAETRAALRERRRVIASSESKGGCPMAALRGSA